MMNPRKFVLICLLFVANINMVTAFENFSRVSASPSELWTQIMACDDAFVQKCYPSWNGGDRGNIDVTHGGATPEVARTFLKFNLSSFQHTPLQAELRVFIETSLNPIDGESEVEVYELPTDNWDEDTITWDNMPTYDDMLDSMSTNFPHGATNRWLSFDVYGYVSGEFGSDRVVSFLLKCHVENEGYVEPHGYSFASTEDSSGNHPELWICYEGERDESANPSFYDDFEDGIIDDMWLSVINRPDESHGKLNCSNLPSGVVYRDPVNVQNSIIDIDIYDEGIDNNPIICLRDRLNTSISPVELNSHDFYYVASYRHNQTHSGWFVFRGRYNGSWAQVATNIIHQAINTTLRINITNSEIHFDEIYNNTKYGIYEEAYALSTHWLFLYLYEEWTGSTWTQYDSFEFRKLWLTDSVKQFNNYLKNDEMPHIYHNTHTIVALDYAAENLSFSVDARSGVTSTTQVYCGVKGKPDKVLINGNEYAEGDHWNYDYERKIVAIEWTHSSGICIGVQWKGDSPDLYPLTIVISILLAIVSGTALFVFFSKRGRSSETSKNVTSVRTTHPGARSAIQSVVLLKKKLRVPILIVTFAYM